MSLFNRVFLFAILASQYSFATNCKIPINLFVTYYSDQTVHPQYGEDAHPRSITRQREKAEELAEIMKARMRFAIQTLSTMVQLNDYPPIVEDVARFSVTYKHFFTHSLPQHFSERSDLHDETGTHNGRILVALQRHPFLATTLNLHTNKTPHNMPILVVDEITDGDDTTPGASVSGHGKAVLASRYGEDFYDAFSQATWMTAAHEMGHLLGLGHSDRACNLMNYDSCTVLPESLTKEQAQTVSARLCGLPSSTVTLKGQSGSFAVNEEYTGDASTWEEHFEPVCGNGHIEDGEECENSGVFIMGHGPYEKTFCLKDSENSSYVTWPDRSKRCENCKCVPANSVMPLPGSAGAYAPPVENAEPATTGESEEEDPEGSEPTGCERRSLEEPDFFDNGGCISDADCDGLTCVGSDGGLCECCFACRFNSDCDEGEACQSGCCRKVASEEGEPGGDPEPVEPVAITL